MASRLHALLLLLLSAAPALAQTVPLPGGGGPIVGGTCSAGDFVNALSTTGVITCATPGGGGGGAPTTATYVTLTTDAGLSSERVLTGTANQVILTDGGPGSTITLSLPQSIDTGASPTLTGLTLTAPILTGNGTAAAPAHSFSAATGSGMWREATSGLMLTSATANTVNIVNSTTAQTFKVHNTYTDASNGEWLEAFWSANTAILRPAANGTGTARDFQIRHGGTTSVAISVQSNANNPIDLANNSGTASTVSSGRVRIGQSSSKTATTGTNVLVSLAENYAPTATSTMLARSLSITPTVNFSNGTPGAGAYETIFVNVTETALPTGQNYLARLQTGGTDRFTVTNTGRVLVGTILQANLGTMANGQMVYCSDCTVSTCAGSGTGAWVFRSAGANVCPF